jgi:hypothetical protein
VNISLYVARAETERKLNALVAKTALETGHEPADRPHREKTPSGDPWEMRHIPIIAAGGIGGAIPGSRPGEGLK